MCRSGLDGWLAVWEFVHFTRETFYFEWFFGYWIKELETCFMSFQAAWNSECQDSAFLSTSYISWDFCILQIGLSSQSSLVELNPKCREVLSTYEDVCFTSHVWWFLCMQGFEDQGEYTQVWLDFPFFFHRKGVHKEQGPYFTISCQQVLHCISHWLLLWSVHFMGSLAPFWGRQSCGPVFLALFPWLSVSYMETVVSTGLIGLPLYVKACTKILSVILTFIPVG
jgi:hypothetical protein